MEPLQHAQQFLRRGDLDGAARVLIEAIALGQGTAPVLRTLGVIYVHQDAPAQGEVLIRRAVEQDGCADDHLALGNALQQQGRHPEAITAYEEAIQQSADSVEAWCNLGLAHHALGHHSNAMDAYTRALDLAPTHLGAWYNLGLLHYAEHDLSAARRAYSAALRIDPEEPDVLNNLANTELALGNRAEAIKLYRRALAVQPDNTTFAENLALAEGQVEPTEEDAAGWWRNIGQELMQRGRTDEAIKAYRKAQALDPADATVQHLLNALTGNGELRPPDSYVETLFDSYAERFEHHLVGQLGYQLPALIRWLCDQQLELHPARVLDLGCGTGLVGVELSEIAGEIVGVDLSAEMLSRSREKGVYAALHHAEVAAWLKTDDTRYDLITAAEVVIYLGDMAPIMPLIARRLAPGGRFIFSTERAEQERVVLEKTGRYAHSRAGIEADAAAAGMSVEMVGKVELRRTRTGWEDGDLYVLKRD